MYIHCSQHLSPVSNLTRGERYKRLWTLIGLFVICSLGCTPRESDPQGRPVFIYAASSLSTFVEGVSEEYRARFPQREVHIELTGSHTARLQIARGAPPGIFISAAPDHVTRLAQLGKVARQETLAYNTLRLMARNDLSLRERDTLSAQISPLKLSSDVPLGVPSAVSSGVSSGVSVTNPARPRWGLGSPRVPLGELSLRILSDLGISERVTPHVVTYALSARALKGRAERGEIDIALLYHTDTTRLLGWSEITLPAHIIARHRARYVIALTRADHTQLPNPSALTWWNLALQAEQRRRLTALEFQ